MSQKLNRRDFLRISALTAAGAALAGCDGGEEEPTATTAPVVPPTAAPRVPVRWFIGLGTGTQPEQVPEEQNWVVDYNLGQDAVNLTLEIVANDVAFDALKTQMAAGNAPDIIGPVGVRGRNEFTDVWLDLTSYLGAVDTSVFGEGALEAWNVPGEGQVGIPIAVYPSALFTKTNLFDEAGLPQPPQVYGDTYDGDAWTVEKMTEVAKLLTVDANGNDSTSAAFDPDNIVQFGFHHQWTDPRGWATLFGAGNFVADDGVTAQCPEHWRAAFNWMYDGMWNDIFMPNGPYQNSDIFAGGNPFGSGNVAMAHCHTWFSCCVPAEDWDFGCTPSYDGVVTSKLHTDMIGILGSTDVPEESVQVLYDIANNGTLIGIWGGMPPVTALQAGFFASWPEGVNWQTIVDGLAYADVPNHEAWMPNFAQADDRVKAFQSTLQDTADLDVDAAIDELVSDLQAIFDAA
jgi:multiple sugar transport system substrate-binding protein